MTNLFELLTTNLNGSTFISIDTVTTPKLTGGRKNLMQGRVTKHTTGANVMVFQNKNINGYQAMVERRLTKEGKSGFELSPRAWGTRLPNCCLVEHKGQLYVEVIFLTAGDTHYELDGVRIDKSEVEGLPSSSNGAQGGLEDKVIIRTFKAANIRSIRINKHSYTELSYETDEVAMA